MHDTSCSYMYKYSINHNVEFLSDIIFMYDTSYTYMYN